MKSFQYPIHNFLNITDNPDEDAGDLATIPSLNPPDDRSSDVHQTIQYGRAPECISDSAAVGS